MTTSARTLLGLLGLALVAGACSGSKAKMEDVSGPGGVHQSIVLSDNLDELEAQLAQREHQLRSRGVAVPDSGILLAGAMTPAPTQPAAGGGDGVEVEEDLDSAPTEEPRDFEAEEAPTAAPEPMSEPAPVDAEDARPSRRDRRAEKKKEKRARANRCQQVCDITDAICGLESHICSLAAAPDHAGDPRYQNACARAKADCDVASKACHDCA